MLLPTGYTHIHIRHRSFDPGVLMVVKNISIKIANARDLRPITRVSVAAFSSSYSTYIIIKYILELFLNAQ